MPIQQRKLLRVRLLRKKLPVSGCHEAGPGKQKCTLESSSQAMLGSEQSSEAMNLVDWFADVTSGAFSNWVTSESFHAAVV